MPPKAKFSKEEIVSAAFALIRESGEEALTAREIASRLGVSTKPIFTYFRTMDELKDEAFKAACDFYREYSESGLEERIPLRGFCSRYISFASEEPGLYRFIFLSGRSNGGNISCGLPDELYSRVVQSVMSFYDMDEETAKSYLLNMLIISQGFAAMIISGSCPFHRDEIRKIGTGFSFALCKAYKEVPGLAKGTAEFEKLFSELYGRPPEEQKPQIQ